jgi:hypothetical protein
MDEHDWKEEQRRVLTRLFDSAFKRREAAPEKEIEADIHRFDIVDKHLDDIPRTAASLHPLTSR